MASYTARKDKDGNIISYQIKVSRGRDKLTGKQLTPYTRTFTPPEGWSKKAIERELNRVMGEFEAACKRGEVLTKQEQKDAAKQAAVEEMKAPTFSKYVEIFLNEKRATLSACTIDNYSQYLEKSVEVFGDRKLKDITAAEIKHFITDLQNNGKGQNTGKPYSNGTIKSWWIALHSMFSSAVEDGYIPYNTMNSIKPPKARKDELTAEPLSYTPEQVKYIFECLAKEPLQWRAMVTFALYTGCRRGEIIGLEWQDVDLKAGTCNICHSMIKSKETGVTMSTPKSGRRRTIYLNSATVKVLREWKHEQNVNALKAGCTLSGAVFTRPTGERVRMNALNNYLTNFGEKYNLPGIHPHALRHTMATIAIANGADVVSVSKILGHSTPSITLGVYAHANEQALRNVSKVCAEAINY